MANEWAEQKLPTGTDGKERPALWDPAKGESGGWDVAQGRDGRQWVRDDSVESQLKKLNETVGSKDNKSRIVDGNGNSLFTVERPGNVQDEDVKAELESIKSTQAEILDRLDGTFDTNVTGSNVEDGIVTKPRIVESFHFKGIEVNPGSFFQVSQFNPDLVYGYTGDMREYSHMYFGAQTYSGTHDWHLLIRQKAYGDGGSIAKDYKSEGSGSIRVVEKIPISFHNISPRIYNESDTVQTYAVAIGFWPI